MGGANRFISALKQSGYRYVHYPTLWWGTECGDEVDDCVEPSGVSETVRQILQNTPVGPLLYRQTGAPSTHVALQRFEQLINYERPQVDAPIVTFMHLQVPHPPLYLDSNCVPNVQTELSQTVMNSAPSLPADILAVRKAAYVAQIECVNSVLLDFVDRLGDDSIVVFAADHGPDSGGQLLKSPIDWSDEDIAERMGVFAATRLPCESNAPSEITLADLLKPVLECAIGAETVLESHASWYAPGTELWWANLELLPDVE
jgi:hypothetical protein